MLFHENQQHFTAENHTCFQVWLCVESPAFFRCIIPFDKICTEYKDHLCSGNKRLMITKLRQLILDGMIRNIQNGIWLLVFTSQSCTSSKQNLLFDCRTDFLFRIFSDGSAFCQSCKHIIVACHNPSSSAIFSASSRTDANLSSAISIGCGVVRSTPATFNSSNGYALLPILRNFR